MQKVGGGAVLNDEVLRRFFRVNYGAHRRPGTAALLSFSLRDSLYRVFLN
jgi:hypothetical protein